MVSKDIQQQVALDVRAGLYSAEMGASILASVPVDEAVVDTVDDPVLDEIVTGDSSSQVGEEEDSDAGTIEVEVADDIDDDVVEDSEYIQDLIATTEADVEAGTYTEAIKDSIIEKGRTLEKERVTKAAEAEASRIQEIETAAEKATQVPIYIHSNIYWDEDRKGFFEGTREQSEEYAEQLAKRTGSSVLVVAPVAITAEDRGFRGPERSYTS